MEGRRPVKKHLTLTQAIDKIRSKEYDPFIEQELIKKINKYPQNTYEKFIRNINLQIERIQRSRNKKPLSNKLETEDEDF